MSTLKIKNGSKTKVQDPFIGRAEFNFLYYKRTISASWFILLLLSNFP